MTIGHKRTRADKSGQGPRQSGFILASEKEVLWHHAGLVKVCVELLFLNLIPIDIVSCWGLKRHCLACSLSLFLQEEVRDSLARALALKARKYTMKRGCEDDLMAGEHGGV